MQLHSVAEGQAELGTASGRMQLGVHGVFAPYYRDHIVENVTRAIEERTGVKYSTARQILINRAYCGYVRHHDDWHPALHEPLVTQAQFDAAQRAHTPGTRRSRDLLSGRVRCGLCGRVLGLEYNDRGQAIYRCKHRDTGCVLIEDLLDAVYVHLRVVACGAPPLKVELTEVGLRPTRRYGTARVEGRTRTLTPPTAAEGFFLAA